MRRMHFPHFPHFPFDFIVKYVRLFVICCILLLPNLHSSRRASLVSRQSRQSLSPRLACLSFPNGCLFGTVTGKGEGTGEGGVAAIADCIGLTNCATDMAIYAAIAL